MTECQNCGREPYGVRACLTRGRCGACYQYWRRHGQERPKAWDELRVCWWCERAGDVIAYCFDYRHHRCWACHVYEKRHPGFLRPLNGRFGRPYIPEKAVCGTAWMIEGHLYWVRDFYWWRHWINQSWFGGYYGSVRRPETPILGLVPVGVPA